MHTRTGPRINLKTAPRGLVRRHSPFNRQTSRLPNASDQSSRRARPVCAARRQLQLVRSSPTPLPCHVAGLPTQHTGHDSRPRLGRFPLAASNVVATVVKPLFPHIFSLRSLPPRGNCRTIPSPETSHVPHHLERRRLADSLPPGTGRGAQRLAARREAPFQRPDELVASPGRSSESAESGATLLA
jgi:hypothetical protein